MKKSKSVRNSNLELLRILCILAIIGDHFTGQSGIVEWGNVGINFFYCAVTSLSRVACSVFIIISAWFSIDKKFNIKKILHVWLTVVMFTVPLTLYCMNIGLASKNDLYNAALPISGSPLWFAGYYIVLMLFAPALNYLINDAPPKIHIGLLLVLLVLMVMFSSITAEFGFFGHDIWSLIFLYLFTGYIKKYKTIPKRKFCFLVFGVCWLVLTWGRACVANSTSELFIVAFVRNYCEFYRARLQTIPNLLMAYSLFLGFYNLPIKSSRLINFLAGKTLGVYCFHQVPCWYMYLWTTLFQATHYSQILHGYKRMMYTVISIVLVWVIGTVLETIRQYISDILIENRKYYNILCEKLEQIFHILCNNSQKKSYIKEVIGFMVIMIMVIMIKGVIIDYIEENSLNTEHSLYGKEFLLTVEQDLSIKDNSLIGVVKITNDGKTIKNISDGTYPVTLGVSILDSNGNVEVLDFQHIGITNKKVLKKGEDVLVDITLENIDDYFEEGYGVRFEIVQEGVMWFDDMNDIYWVKKE